MKKILTILLIMIFAVSSFSFAKKDHPKKDKAKTKIEKVKKIKKIKAEKKIKKIKKEKIKGKKTVPPKGVVKAAEKAKGKKKGFWSRWFGRNKDTDDDENVSEDDDEDENDEEEDDEDEAEDED